MKRRITDEELDRLLAAPLREGSPRLAERVLARVAEPAAVPARGRRWIWYLVPALAAAGFAVLMTTSSEPTRDTADFEALFALEESLAPAAALLDPLNRELCTEMPVETNLR